MGQNTNAAALSDERIIELYFERDEQAIKETDRKYRFMSRYYIARPIAEIARLLGCSESTVNKEIAAIKRDLKERLEKEGYAL